MILDLLEVGDQRRICYSKVRVMCLNCTTGRCSKRSPRRHDNFEYVPALNEPNPDDHWEGFTGFVHEAAVAHFDGKFRRNKGLSLRPTANDRCRRGALMQGRLFERDIHMERFLTAADGAGEAT